MTSAPKSDRITAALGPAMKLARSTTLSPEKMLSPAIVSSSGFGISAAVEQRRPLFEKGGCAFPLVFRRSAETEIGSLKQQALVLAHLHSLVCCFERELH